MQFERKIKACEDRPFIMRNTCNSQARLPSMPSSDVSWMREPVQTIQKTAKVARTDHSTAHGGVCALCEHRVWMGNYSHQTSY